MQQSLSQILHKEADPYPFEQVCRSVSAMQPAQDEDVTDYRTKLRRARECYNKLFLADRKHKTEVKRLKTKLKENAEGTAVLQREIHHGKHLLEGKEEELRRSQEETLQVRDQLCDTERKLAELKQQLQDSEERTRRALEESARLQGELDALNNTFVVRQYHKMRGLFGRDTEDEY